MRLLGWSLRVLGFLLAVVGGAGAGIWAGRSLSTALVFLVLFAIPGVVLVFLAPTEEGS